MRSDILQAARKLTLDGGTVPSLNAVAEAAGVSKGGLMHHFPTRSALVVGLARQALDEVDAAMSAAAAAGTAARAWLELSLPEGDERALMQALASSFRPADDEFGPLLNDSTSAIARWESLIAAEVGDAAQAHAIRLVGDALVANSLVGFDAPEENIDELLSFLTASRTRGETGR